MTKKINKKNYAKFTDKELKLLCELLKSELNWRSADYEYEEIQLVEHIIAKSIKQLS